MKRPTTIRLTPELEAASERYVAANESNLAQLTRLALRRFLEAEGFLDEATLAKARGANRAAERQRSWGPGGR